MIDYKKELNEQQFDVVKNGDGYCLVLAGAGSGKTRTVTYRVAYLLEQGVKPEEVLLLTFTNKAANEMVHRVRQLTGSDADLPWAGTFHSIGNKILRLHADKLGYDKNFSILDMEDSKKLIKKCLEALGINRKEERFPSAKVLQSIISYARNSETTISNVINQKHPKFRDHIDTIQHISEEYEKRKRKANAMDFDDLLVNLYRLLKKEKDIKEKYTKQFKYVLGDEYQDTNQIQSSIINLFADHHENLLVVGDDAQSIYSFRAADISNILEFEENHPDAKKFKLETNYRSTPEIIQAANEVIKNNENQHQKDLRSANDEHTKPKVKEFATQKKEAKFITDKIDELVRQEDMGYSDVAVLFRASYHSQVLEVELSKEGIGYDFRGGLRFFDRAHVKDTLSYLRILNNPDDEMAWSRVMNMQTGIGEKTTQKIINKINKLETLDNLSHVGSILNARAQKGWTDFLSIYESMQKVEDNDPSELIKAIKDSDYKDYLENEYTDYQERLRDIEQLASTAAGIEADGDKLQKFLAEASLQEKYNAEDSADEKIVMSTIHQAKGLEWKAVFIINVADGQFPNDRALKSPNGLEEERRLFYVALTRAEKHLHLTYPVSGVGYNSKFQKPSQFIKEVSHMLQDGEEEVQDGGLTYEYEEDEQDSGSFLSSLSDL